MDRSLTDYNSFTRTFHSETTEEETSTLNRATIPPLDQSLLTPMGANSAWAKPTSTHVRPKSRAKSHEQTAFMLIPIAHIAPGFGSKSMRRKRSIFEVRQGRLARVSVCPKVLQAIRTALSNARFGSRELRWMDAPVGPGTRQPRNELMLSKELRTLRLQKDLSIFQLSQKSGVRLNLLADLERGAWQADEKTLAQLASALGVQENPLFQHVRQGPPDERGKLVLQQATNEGDHDNA